MFIEQRQMFGIEVNVLKNMRIVGTPRRKLCPSLQRLLSQFQALLYRFCKGLGNRTKSIGRLLVGMDLLRKSYTSIVLRGLLRSRGKLWAELRAEL